jgi:hypothetical protein
MRRRKRPGGGWRSRGAQTLRRRSRRRSQKSRLLIVCEGKETEPNYFRGLRDEESVRQRFTVVVLKGKGGSGLAVVQQACAEKQKAGARGEGFDEVWCVFDVEQQGQRQDLNNARTLAEQNKIKVAISNPCFETWLLAHFLRTSKSFANGDKVVAELNKYWQCEFGQDYEKNDHQLFLRLASRVRTAIMNARKVRNQDWASFVDIVECNSATDVYQLVEVLSP